MYFYFHLGPQIKIVLEIPLNKILSRKNWDTYHARDSIVPSRHYRSVLRPDRHGLRYTHAEKTQIWNISHLLVDKFVVFTIIMESCCMSDFYAQLYFLLSSCDFYPFLDVCTFSYSISLHFKSQAWNINASPWVSSLLKIPFKTQNDPR